MRFFRLRRKPESDEEEKELVLDADTEEEAQLAVEAHQVDYEQFPASFDAE